MKKIFKRKQKKEKKLYTLYVRVPDGTGDKNSNTIVVFRLKLMLYSEAISETNSWLERGHSVQLFEIRFGTPVLAYRSKHLDHDGTGLKQEQKGNIISNPDQLDMHEYLAEDLEDTNGKENDISNTRPVTTLGDTGLDQNSQSRISLRDSGYDQQTYERVVDED